MRKLLDGDEGSTDVVAATSVSAATTNTPITIAFTTASAIRLCIGLDRMKLPWLE